MSKADTAAHTPESLAMVAAAIEAIAQRLTRTAETMREKDVATLEIKNHAGLRAGLSTLRGFGMSAEEALEEWFFDQRVFPAEAAPAAAKPRSEAAPRKSRKSAEPPEADAA